MFNNIFKNKKVLVTGHTGFKGGWLCSWLKILNAKIYGMSLPPPTTPSLFEVLNVQNEMNSDFIDLRDRQKVSEYISDVKPDFIFHLAAQPLVGASYQDPVLTYETNFLGTLNILETLRSLNHNCCAIMITSDKSYKNVEWVWGYKETDILGGDDPYSASKASTEILINSHIKSFLSKENNSIKVAIARAGNVIGGGDWAEGRIVPDCIRAWSENKNVFLRNPKSTRPWQHVLEPLSGYLTLACLLNKNNNLHGEPFNFGPSSDSNYDVEFLVKKISSHWGNANFSVKHTTKTKLHEAGLLKLNCDKSIHFLNWRPVLNFDETVSYTSLWYKNYYFPETTSFKFTEDQIFDYTKKAKMRELSWAL